MLDVSSLATHVIFNLPLGGIEGFADGHHEVAPNALLAGLAVHDDFFAWKRDVDSDVIQVATPMVAMGHLDHDSAASDSRAELVELGGVLTHYLLDLLRTPHPLERDLHWQLHGVRSLLTCRTELETADQRAAVAPRLSGDSLANSFPI